ncbi:hypothetical protein L6R52_12630 [Myxococcota bacterium]|nr:hypothetical protein [Myxococcota bacterium]
MNDFLGAFGIKGAGIGLAIDTLTGNSLGQLANLQDIAAETALGRGTGPIERMSMSLGGLPPFCAMPSPMAMYPGLVPLCGAGYAGGFQRVDLAPGSSNVPFFSKLFDPSRRSAAMFEHQLRTNPWARAAFESQIGGRIVDFGVRNDGVFTVQRFTPGFAPVPGVALNPLAGAAFGAFSGLQAAVHGALGMGALGMGALGMGAGGLGALFGGNPFHAFTTLGLGAVGLGGMQAPLGGLGFGSWNPNAMPGNINNTNPGYERAHQLEVDAVLRDPSLTVEDKVTLMIMLIMKKMDADIERQAQYINSIQQQQSDRGGGKGKGGKGFMGIGGKGGGKGKGGGGGNDKSPSIDVETMKLKRMVDKRGQMFDMLRQIIDKYNQTAKGIIDSIGR